MGAQLVKEVAAKAADLAGDGTTTATVLAQSIMTLRMKNVTSDANPMDIKKGIDKAVKEAVQQLKTKPGKQFPTYRTNSNDRSLQMETPK